MNAFKNASKLRTVYFRGRTMRLDMFDTHRSDSYGKTIIAYRLSHKGVPIFEGSDFAASPLHADDSDVTVASLMTFLTLRPGDTDAEYFANYTPAQLAFAIEYGEELDFEVRNRFGEF